MSRHSCFRKKAVSPEYQSLVQGIEKLRNGLLSYSERQDGDYSDEELLKCQAFIVLSHAEIENYLERISRRIMRAAEKRWQSSNTLDRVIATLLAYRQTQIRTPADDPKDRSSKSELGKIIESCIKEQDDVIKNNHGIKQKNLSHLLCPLGVLPQDFDNVLLIELTELGVRRGKIVHRQNRVSLTALRDPISVELAGINKVIDEIKKFDLRLEEIGVLPTLE